MRAILFVAMNLPTSVANAVAIEAEAVGQSAMVAAGTMARTV